MGRQACVNSAALSAATLACKAWTPQSSKQASSQAIVIICPCLYLNLVDVFLCVSNQTYAYLAACAMSGPATMACQAFSVNSVCEMRLLPPAALRTTGLHSRRCQISVPVPPRQAFWVSSDWQNCLLAACWLLA